MKIMFIFTTLPLKITFSVVYDYLCSKKNLSTGRIANREWKMPNLEIRIKVYKGLGFQDDLLVADISWKNCLSFMIVFFSCLNAPKEFDLMWEISFVWMSNFWNVFAVNRNPIRHATLQIDFEFYVWHDLENAFSVDRAKIFCIFPNIQRIGMVVRRILMTAQKAEFPEKIFLKKFRNFRESLIGKVNNKGNQLFYKMSAWVLP